MQKEPQKNSDRYTWNSRRGFNEPAGGGGALLMVASAIYLIVLIGIVAGVGIITVSLFSSGGAKPGGTLLQPENGLSVEVKDFTPDSYGYSLVQIGQDMQQSSVRIEMAENGSFNYDSPVYGVAFADGGYVIATSPRLSATSEVRAVSNGTVYQAEIVGWDGATGVTVIKIEGITLVPASFSAAVYPGDRAAVAYCTSSGTAVAETTISSTVGITYYRAGSNLCRAEALSVNTAETYSGGFAAIDKVGRVIGFSCPVLGGTSKNLLAAGEAFEIAQSIVENGSVSGRWRTGFSGEPVAGELLRETGGGLLITYIEPASGLRAAGVGVGDVVLTVNGKMPESQDEIWDTAQLLNNKTVTLRIYLVETAETITTSIRFIPDSGEW